MDYGKHRKLLFPLGLQQAPRQPKKIAISVLADLRIK